MDEEPFPRLHLGPVNEGGIRRLVHEGEGRGFLERHRIGNGEDARAVGDGALGIRAQLDHGEDALALMDSRHLRAHREDDPGHLVPRAEGEGRLHLILALDDQDVGEIAADGLDVDQYLAWIRRRIGNLRVLHLGWLAPLGRDHGFHVRR